MFNDAVGLQVGAHQPAKLATHTEAQALLRIGGLLIDGQVRWALSIPRLGSIIAENSFDKPVIGMDQIPPDQQPPANLVHLAFQSMVGIGSALVLLVLLFWFARTVTLLLRRRNFALARFGAVGAVGAVLLGWAAGQYPWLLVDQLRIDQATGARATLWGPLIVVALAAVLVVPALGYLLWLTQQPGWIGRRTRIGRCRAAIAETMDR